MDKVFSVIVHRSHLSYLIFIGIVYSSWLIYTADLNLRQIYEAHWPAVLTMIFGAFIAGSSPEGSAAIAYPIFTLFLDIQPAVARNFAFAIQSIGMTSAALLILGMRIKVEWNYIKFVTCGGVFGLVAGTFWVVPLVSPVLAKLFFVSLWLSFGISLWKQNKNLSRYVATSIDNFTRRDAWALIIFGFVGGIISAIFGTGINILSFCLMTIYYKVSEKIATPSSIIIMTFETFLGFFIHAAIIKDFQPIAFDMWIACIPIVIIFAPLGAFITSKVSRRRIAEFLYFILCVQFIGALIVIRPTAFQFSVSLTIVFFGVLLFTNLGLLKRGSVGSDQNIQ